jgi:hypothetical protein
MTPEALIRAQRYMALSDAYKTLAQGIKYPTTVAATELKLAKDRIEVTTLLLAVAEGKTAQEAARAPAHVSAGERA